LYGHVFEQRVVTAAALSKARKKLKHAAFIALNQIIQQELDAQAMRQTWHGMRVLAVDGSSLHLPLESSSEAFFGTEHGLPVARISVLMDVLDEQVLDAVIAPLNVDERGCAVFHLDHAPGKSLILFDRGYPAHWLYALLHQRRTHFLMRVKTNQDSATMAFYASPLQDQIVQLPAPRGAEIEVFANHGIPRDHSPPLRLVKYRLPNGKIELLATSLLDAEQFPIESLGALYHRRWGAETQFRQLKQTLDMENFSGRSVEVIKQDFHARVLLRNVTMLFGRSQQAEIDHQGRHKRLRWRTNFTQAISRMKNTFLQMIVTPCTDLLENHLKLLRSSLSAVRPGRHFRHKRRRLATHGNEGYKRTR